MELESEFFFLTRNSWFVKLLPRFLYKTAKSYEKELKILNYSSNDCGKCAAVFVIFECETHKNTLVLFD